MSWDWKPYVSAAARAANAAKELAKLAKRGVAVAPIRLEGKKIVRTFWGKAWCENLEAYSDFSNRLPRGRTYVRNGSVLDLQINRGKVTALVHGSELYRISIEIRPLAAPLWKHVQEQCAGKVQSLLDLLQGRLSESVMQVVTHQDKGLFPKPAEIQMECSCPDWAGMCKHLAATLYGIGARLDAEPELLFRLRGVDAAELISETAAAQVVGEPAQNALSGEDLSEIFGIEIESAARSSPAAPAQTSTAKAPLKKRASKKLLAQKPGDVSSKGNQAKRRGIRRTHQSASTRAARKSSRS
jgi:uncharacterized Zn finger protein